MVLNNPKWSPELGPSGYMSKPISVLVTHSPFCKDINGYRCVALQVRKMKAYTRTTHGENGGRKKEEQPAKYLQALGSKAKQKENLSPGLTAVYKWEFQLEGMHSLMRSG